MARLSSLKPRWCSGASVGPGVWQLTFTCPLCGPGYEVSIYMHAGQAADTHDPPILRNGACPKPEGSGGCGPTAAHDYGNHLDIPTVIRNLSD